MNRSDVPELHYITPIENLLSILEKGILSNYLCSKLPHVSVAAADIQDRRDPKTIPGGLPLHRYVNLYLHARNPMLYKLKERHTSLCILRIDPRVMDLPKTVITSQNASSDYVRFYPSPQGLAFLDRELVFAEYWTHADYYETLRHKSIKCSEVLVPNRVDLGYIIGGYISNQRTLEQVRATLEGSGLNLTLTLDKYLFFLEGRQ